MSRMDSRTDSARTGTDRQSYVQAAGDAFASGNLPYRLAQITARAKAQVTSSANTAELFLEDIDEACSELARDIAIGFPLIAAPIGFDRPANIYLVTEIYHSGGHRKLIEQLIAARPTERHIVLFTGALENTRAFSTGAIVEAGGFPVYPDPSLDHFDRLLWLREKLAAFTGQRLFAVHHPEDVLASVVLAEFGEKYGGHAYIVHHADTVASVGVDLPHATHLAIRPEQQREILKERPAYSVHVLPLIYAPELVKPAFTPEFYQAIKADDRGFLSSGALNTATCGGMHKFYGKGALSLPDMLATILMTTRGYHYHIGSIDTKIRQQIETALRDAGQALDRLVLVGEVASVAGTLIDKKIDLFLTSWPTGGGLTVVEAAFAGVPVAVYGGGTDSVGRYLGGVTHAPSDVLVWKTVADLEESLRGFWKKDGIARLESMSEASRVWAGLGHSWKKYQRRLDAIIRVTETPKRRAVLPNRRRVAGALVDPVYYKAENPDVDKARLDPVQHFLSHGEAELRAFMPLFDAAFYLSQLSRAERKIAKKMAATHYVMRGEASGYKPHPLFDPAFCKAAFAAAGLPLAQTGDPLKDCVLLHYLATPGRIAPHMLFDPDHYARQAGEVSDTQPLLLHFLETGAEDRLSPHPLIDPERMCRADERFDKVFLNYIRQSRLHLDEPGTALLFDGKKLAGEDADRYEQAAPTLLWAHLIEGNQTGRNPHLLVDVAHIEKMRPGTLVSATAVLQKIAVNKLNVDTHPLVQGRYILKQAPYAESLPISLTQYFIENSTSHNIDPCPFFSTQYYLYNYPDLQRISVSPLEHFLAHGQTEGRLPHPAFNGNVYYQRVLRQHGVVSPILNYVSRGMALFRPCMALDDAQSHMSAKMAAGLFAVGSDAAACDLLAASIHPETEFKHPTLITETRPLCSTADEADEVTEIYPEEQVLVDRPSVVAQSHIAPPIGGYLAPAATAARYAGATLVPGNDGFIAKSGHWVDHGLTDFDPETMLLKENGAVVAAVKGKVLLRCYSSEMSLPSGILASGTYSHNYYHFLLEILPRVLLAADIAPAGTPVLADDGMPDQHYQMLRLYLPDHRILRLARHNTVKVGMLYVGSMPNIIQDAFETDMPPADAVRLHPVVIRRIAQAGAGLPSGKANRLYLPRDSSVRKLLNSHDIEAALRLRDFDVMRCETLSFCGQVNLFSQSGGGIVGQSGAHLANMLFAPAGTRVFALFSNAPGTNFYLWSVLGAILDHDVINVAGWRIMGTAPGRMPQAHESFTVSPAMLTPFFPLDVVKSDETDPVKEARIHLDAIYGACTEADTLTSAWGLRSGVTPAGFDAGLIHARRRVLALLDKLPCKDVTRLLEHPFFQDFSRNIRSGFVTLTDFNAAERKTIDDLKARFAELSKRVAPAADAKKDNKAGDDKAGDLDIARTLALGMMYIPAWKLPLAGDLALFDEDLQTLYLNWLSTPPYLYAAGDDVGYVAYTERLLVWLSRHLEPDVDADIRDLVKKAATQIDMGQLLLVDAPLRPTLEARNTLMEHLGLRNGPAPRKLPRPADLSQGRIRVGLLCRTFEKGPDSEAVVAFFRGFDPEKYEIFAYSVAFRDRVVASDAGFDEVFDEAVEHRRTLSGGPHDVRETILADELDVFLYANATTFGVRDLERALYHRVAPIQMSLNSHLPISPGFPSFDYFVTGRSDDPEFEVLDEHHPETVLRVEGPVINFLNSLTPKKLPGFTRATLGLSDDDIVMMNGGSSQKLRSEGLRTMLRALKAVPNGKLLLAPYNPGWAARSQAFAFNRQLADAAQAVGVSMNRIIVLGELSVAEAEAAISLSDIYLSSFPHGGATMTHLALIYGTPPVVLRRAFTRSIDQFLVSTLGFEQMLVNTPDDYVALVADLARNTVRRKQLSADIKAAAKTPPFVASLEFSHSMQDVVGESIEKARAAAKPAVAVKTAEAPADQSKAATKPKAGPDKKKTPDRAAPKKGARKKPPPRKPGPKKPAT